MKTEDAALEHWVDYVLASVAWYTERAEALADAGEPIDKPKGES